MKRGLTEKQKVQGKVYVTSARKHLKSCYTNYIKFLRHCAENKLTGSAIKEELKEDIRVAKYRVATLERKYL